MVRNPRIDSWSAMDILLLRTVAETTRRMPVLKSTPYKGGECMDERSLVHELRLSNGLWLSSATGMNEKSDASR